MTAKQAQAAWDALRRERDDLLLAIDRCEETKTALHMNLRAMRDERDELAALVEVMRDALKLSARHFTVFKNSSGWRAGEENALAVCNTALALPNTASDILRQRDARVLREAAVKFMYGARFELEQMADELERENG